jgi:hypothetical protein
MSEFCQRSLPKRLREIDREPTGSDRRPAAVWPSGDSTATETTTVPRGDGLPPAIKADYIGGSHVVP